MSEGDILVSTLRAALITINYAGAAAAQEKKHAALAHSERAACVLGNKINI
jgi:hypothetical protein